MSSKRFIELDLVRGLATCWVVCVHLWLVNFLPVHYNFHAQEGYMQNYFDYVDFAGKDWSLEKLFPLSSESISNLIFNGTNAVSLCGYQAVSVFFVLSGFGLAYSYYRKPIPAYLIFLKRRLSRLYQPYWILLISCFLLPALRGTLFYGNLAQNCSELCVVREFVLIGYDSLIPYSWFLFPLLQFSLIFPVLWKFLKQNSIKAFLGKVLFVQVIYTFLILFTAYNIYPSFLGNDAYPGYIAISRAFEFCLGMALAKAYVHYSKQTQRFLQSDWVLLGAALCEVLGVTSLFQGVYSVNISGYVIPTGAIFHNALIGFSSFILIFRLASLCQKIPPIRGVILYISQFSYEIYLTHFIGLLITSHLFLSEMPEESISTTLVRFFFLYFTTLQACLVIAVLLRQVTRLATSQTLIRYYLGYDRATENHRRIGQ